MKRYLPATALLVVLLLVALVLIGRGGEHRSTIGAGHATDRDSAGRRPPANRPGASAPKPAKPTAKVKGAHNDSVPILMYHVTKAPPPGTPYPDLWVTPADFKRQMNWLAARGYTGITLTRLFDYWDDGYALPKRPVVISFDDGYPSHDKVARPVLAAHKWPGVLFIELNNVNSSQTGFTASMVRDLIASGWEIGSHTVSHPDLTTVGSSRLKFELRASRARIKRKYDVVADFFCYPAGKFNATVVAAVKTAGYRGATTVIEGVGESSDPYKLKRVRINGSDRVAGFVAKMRQAER